MLVGIIIIQVETQFLRNLPCKDSTLFKIMYDEILAAEIVRSKIMCCECVEWFQREKRIEVPTHIDGVIEIISAVKTAY